MDINFEKLVRYAAQKLDQAYVAFAWSGAKDAALHYADMMTTSLVEMRAQVPEDEISDINSLILRFLASDVENYKSMVRLLGDDAVECDEYHFYNEIVNSVRPTLVDEYNQLQEYELDWVVNCCLKTATTSGPEYWLAGVADEMLQFMRRIRTDKTWDDTDIPPIVSEYRESMQDIFEDRHLPVMLRATLYETVFRGEPPFAPDNQVLGPKRTFDGTFELLRELLTDIEFATNAEAPIGDFSWSDEFGRSLPLFIRGRTLDFVIDRADWAREQSRMNRFESPTCAGLIGPFKKLYEEAVALKKSLEPKIKDIEDGFQD